jgi:hypothetical protein
MIFAVHLSPIRIGGAVVAQLANMSGSSSCLTGPTVVTIVAGNQGLTGYRPRQRPAITVGPAERSSTVGKIIVFGAGGRAGRRVVAEAVSRGHQVTAVVRDAGKHQDLGTAGVSVVRGDVTVSDEVAALAAGHDAAVNAAARLDVPSEQFFPAAARALVDGLARAGVSRLVVIGVGTALETAPGVAVHDAPEFPAEYRAFSVGHADQTEVLRGGWPGA